MALGWAPQLVAMLYEDHGNIVAPLLRRLAATYPQALYFPFRVSKAALAAHPGVQADPVRADALRELSARLHAPKLEDLVAGGHMQRPFLEPWTCSGGAQLCVLAPSPCL